LDIIPKMGFLTLLGGLKPIAKKGGLPYLKKFAKKECQIWWKVEILPNPKNR